MNSQTNGIPEGMNSKGKLEGMHSNGKSAPLTTEATKQISLEVELISGNATPAGTANYRDRFPDFISSFRELGSTGLTCSAIGFGGYRVDARVPLHRAALALAIRKGVNIIDTSANYADGNSERLVGEVLRGMIETGATKREEIIVVTKGGYLQGENFERARIRLESEDADLSAGSELAELTRYSGTLWHSIHPDFLKDQITRSLERLQLTTIDVFLLHNPEYYIQWAIKDGVAEEDARAEYERRIHNAFAYLETEVALGRIQFYGISSNTFPRPEESIDRTSLERSLQSAERIAKEQKLDRHHFAVIQLPLNIYEHGGVTELNQTRATRSVIAFAREKGIGVLINRPLNAIVQNRIVRLADFPEREFPPAEDIQDLVHDLALQEEEFKNGILKDIAISPQSYEAVKQLLSLGKSLDDRWQHIGSLEEWKDISTTVLAPRIQYCFDLLRPIAKNEPKVFAFLTEYADSADVLIEHINNYFSTQAYNRSVAIHEVLDHFIPEEFAPLSLSQKAVTLIRSIPGVSTVLVGMRSEEYVEDIVNSLYAAQIPDAEKIWIKLGEKRVGSEVETNE
jgi:aryl-alcohol dehydrogenase-like predicted oxidoreductase